MANPEGLVFDVLDDEFEASLWTPFREYLEAHGVSLRLGTRAVSLERESGSWTVTCADGAGAAAEPERSDGVVMAVTVPGLQAVLEASPRLGSPAWRRDVEALRLTLPFVVWRLWLDRPVAEERQPFVGTAGYGVLDNISVYETFEAESRRWADRTGGSVVELHAYAVPEHMTEEELRETMLAGLHDLYPETRDAGVIHEVFRIDRDCPAFPPRGHAARPGVDTPVEGLTLAGDFVRLDFPSALMEKAAASGFLAANRLLARWEVEPEPVWSVPRYGPLARRR
jgi:isorenieratene synthase